MNVLVFVACPQILMHFAFFMCPLAEGEVNLTGKQNSF